MSSENKNHNGRPVYVQANARVHLVKRGPKHAARRSPKHARTPHHARYVSLRRRLVAPGVSFGLAAVLTVALLVGFGGQHAGERPTGQTMAPAGKLGPLAAAASTLNPDDPGQAVRDSFYWSHRRTRIRSLEITEPPKTVVTHPKPGTTVTTVTQVTVTPKAVKTVTTVTTVVVHAVAPSTTRLTSPAAPVTTTTVRTTTTTTPVAPTPAAPTPIASGVDPVPDAPASLGAPTSVVFSDNFDTGSLDTSVWAPEWFKDGSTANNTVMDSSNVSVGPNGLDLQLASNGTGGLVSSNPDDGVAGHTGFQIAPSPGKPVYVEFQATLPGASGHVANWPALWLDGQTWPEDGEIDVMEGLGGYTAYHIHYGSTGEGSQGPGSAVNDSAGTHTFGVLWTTTSITFVYDGNVVGSLSESLTSPMYLVLENSFSSADPLLPATMDVRYVRVWQ